MDVLNGFTWEYHYDTDNENVDRDGDGVPETSASQCYKSRNNRLMWSKTLGPGVHDWVEYQYDDEGKTAGSRVLIKRTDWTTNTVYETTFQYNSAGEVWFVSRHVRDLNDPRADAQVGGYLLVFAQDIQF